MHRALALAHHNIAQQSQAEMPKTQAGADAMTMQSIPFSSASGFTRGPAPVKQWRRYIRAALAPTLQRALHRLAGGR